MKLLEICDLEREEYSAPNYEFFTFETSGLAQMSGDDPTDPEVPEDDERG